LLASVTFLQSPQAAKREKRRISVMESPNNVAARYSVTFLDIRAHLKLKPFDTQGEHVAIQRSPPDKCFVICKKAESHFGKDVQLRSSLHK
jgi:hypothetical protein